MTVSVTNDRTMRRDGQQYPDKYQTDWTIEFVSEDMIRPTFVGTAYSPRGTYKTPAEVGELTPSGVRKKLHRAVAVPLHGCSRLASLPFCVPTRLAP
jgi:hypothetical protein